MRKSLILQQLGRAPPPSAPTEAPTRRGAAPAQGGECEVRREAFCPLYSEADLTPSMRGKLTAFFRAPVQDPGKVQMMDPSRRTKTLGLTRSAPRPAADPAPSFAMPLPVVEEPEAEEFKYDPLVLWSPEEGAPDGSTPIEVDPILCRYLRPHQREGVQFLFDCTMGMREYEVRPTPAASPSRYAPSRPRPSSYLCAARAPDASLPTTWAWARPSNRSQFCGPSCVRGPTAIPPSRTLSSRAR